MPAECAICTDARVGDIHRAIDGGGGVNATARAFGIPPTNLKRHLRQHRTSAASSPAPAAQPPAQPPATPPTTPAAAGAACRRPCLVCRSPQRDTIESALLSGEPAEAIARAHAGDGGPSADTVRRHATQCIPELLRAAREMRIADLATEARAKVQALVDEAESIVTAASKKGTLRERAACLTAARGVLELLARITGELGGEIELRILESPHWQAVQLAIVAGIAAIPDAGARLLARTHVGAALRQLEGSRALPPATEDPAA